ncbi:MAG: hypothetical protein IPL39_07510 [Opitutaceae bacterium]|nr:hypothetical protein [Opitutaceae bacterium]
MTHEKFIELLNLYLDGDLPPADAAALEREIHGNVERRRIYRQYCQMQKACTHLAERFREEASPAAQFRSGAVVAIPRRAGGEWLRSFGLVASGALAACAVFVAMRVSVSQNTVPSVAQTVAAPVATVATAPQPAVATTTVALSNPALFNNPWAAGPGAGQRLVGFAKLSSAKGGPVLTVPELKLPPGTEDMQVDLQPYGTPPGAVLRMEEIEAAAFQFPR